jgi:hypothetical protein
MKLSLILKIPCFISLLHCSEIRSLLLEPQTPDTLREIVKIVDKKDFRRAYNYMHTTHNCFAEIIPYWKILLEDASRYQHNKQKIHLPYLDRLRLDLIDNLIEFLTQWEKLKETLDSLKDMGFDKAECDEGDESLKGISDIRLGYLMQLMTQANVILKVATNDEDCKDLLDNIRIVGHKHCNQRSLEHMDYWAELRENIISRSSVFDTLAEQVRQPILVEFIRQSINAWDKYTKEGHEVLTKALAFCSITPT